MKTLKTLRLLPLLMLAACQSPQLAQVPAQMPAHVRQAAIAPDANGIETLPLTAKMADDEGMRLSQAWAPGAVLTHVMGRMITASGQPHASQGSWTFSYIDKQNPEKALQIVFKVKMKPEVRTITRAQLPQALPLEIRAWGLDSDRAVLKGKQYFGTVSLRQMELTQDVNGTLLWAFDGKPLLDAMHGRPYELLRR